MDISEHKELNSMVNKIQSLSGLDRINIYMHYYITQIGLKYNFEVIDKTNWKHGWGLPHKECGGLAFYYLWKDIKIKTLEEFYSEQNLKIIDYGESWKENGFAKRYGFQCYGIYDWYCKFQDKFKTNDKHN